MSISIHDFDVATHGRGFYEVTDTVAAAIAASDIDTGIASLFVRHTSASLTICENADPDVLVDLGNFMARLVPDGDPRNHHDAEGPDDMPAHIRSVLTATDLTLPVRDGRLALGTWQGVYLWEHRARPHRRALLLTTVGEARG